MKVLYVDVDGTLVGPGGDLFYGGTTRVADALLRARAADLDIVPVSGRGRLQIFELCRLLGLSRGVAELGCIHVTGRDVRYELGAFPFVGETPVEAMLGRGAVQVAIDAGLRGPNAMTGLRGPNAMSGLEPHDPWNEGREATYLLRGKVDVAAVNAALGAAGFEWCELVDNGLLARRADGKVHAYHLAPAGTGKAFGVRLDRLHHGVLCEDTAYVGDSASDLDCAAEVGSLWLVANADGGLHWPNRTAGSYGDGVAEVIDRLLTAFQ